ncbi:MAG: Fe-S protein assembly co-chaperone HscB [Burkholderiales bacterium]|nr:Fe-S protein assembly co-chaperone HscB [Burkholderiales bacterium]
MIDFSRNHFALFGLPPSYRIDGAALDAAYRKLQSQVHPDRFARGTDAERRMALQSSARVNEAYRALKDPVERAQYLLAMNGIEPIGEKDTQLPMEFLEAQLARREAADDALAAGDLRTLSSLREAVRGDAREIEDLLSCTLGAEGDYAAARPRVRELTFLARLAEDIGAMAASLDE